MIIRSIDNVEKIRNEFIEHGFVHINVGKVTVDIVKQISKYFGELKTFKQETYMGEEKQVLKVSEDAILSSNAVDWHRDMCYDPEECHGSLLAFIECDTETYTEFVDCNIAWDHLDKETQDYLKTVTSTYAGKPIWWDTRPDLLKDAISRVIGYEHPITGQTTLYFSPETMVHIDKPFQTRDYVLHCEPFAFKHYWHPGDILVYDNIRMLHRRPAFNCHRVLWRTNFNYESYN